LPEGRGEGNEEIVLNGHRVEKSWRWMMVIVAEQCEYT
jgi:hypothetical protein